MGDPRKDMPGSPADDGFDILAPLDGQDLLTAEEAALPERIADLSSEVVDPASLAHDGEPEVEGLGEDAASARYSVEQVRNARELITRLYAIRRAVRFYPLEHPAVTELILEMLGVLRQYHNEGVDVALGFFEGEILLGEQLLPEESVMFDQLARDMMALGVGSVIIQRGVTTDELARMMRLLTLDEAAVACLGGLEHAVDGLHLEHVVIGSARVIERVGKGAASESGDDAGAAYGGAVSLIREIDRLMRLNQHVSTGKIKGVVRSLVDNVLSNRYAMLQLTGLKNYDEYTFFHSANVAILSLALGATVTTDYRFLSSLGVGALLHDIGKLSVDVSILNKPGALSPEEWATVRQHPVAGAQLVSLLPGVDKSAIVTILEHHMRFDGSGYPARRPIRAQHLASRIVAVADTYDAMTSRRSYSAARVQDEAMALLAKSAGSSLDPVLTRQFVRIMGLYPPRSVVRLQGNEVGIVLRPSEVDPMRPVVRIIADSSGAFIDPVDFDLFEHTETSVKGCIDPLLLNIDVDAYL